ncbi:hypothetical protein BS78_03G105500 [Paspalum vaginatum]|nr:hypothetical protein BS78_03G105500 [Paspalum vaginatum]
MMDMVLSAVGGDLVSRFMSFIIEKFQTPFTTGDDRGRLQRLLLRAGTIVKEADGRRVSNHGMLLQLRQLKEAMYRGYYELDTSGAWASQPERRVAVSNHKLQIDILDDLEATLDGMKEFLLILMHCPPIVRQPYSAYLFVEKCMFGRRMEKEHIINFLLNPSSSLEVLPIIGRRYVGKKTLVEHACMEEIVQRNFSRILHLSSDDLKNLANDNTLDRLRKFGSSDGRFLIVVRLVHKADVEAWVKIYNPLVCSEIGSKAIIISEMEQVSSLGTVQALTLTKLQQEEHWYFFRVLAFGSANPYDHHPDLSSIAKEIAREMYGSFMLTCSVARMLRANLNKQFWSSTLRFVRNSWRMHILAFGKDPRDAAQSRNIFLSYYHTYSHDGDGPLMLLCKQKYETRSMIQAGGMEILKTAEEVYSARNLKHGDEIDVLIQSQIPPYYKYIFKCVVTKSERVYPEYKCHKRKRNQQIE